MSDGTNSIKLYSNGVEVAPHAITDTLDFFDSSGNISSNPSPYESATKAKAYQKALVATNTKQNDGFLEASAPSPLPTNSINVGFYWKTIRTFFHNQDAFNGTNTQSHKHRILYIGPSGGTSTSIDDQGLHVELVGVGVYPFHLPMLKISVYNSIGQKNSATYNITSYKNENHKYLIYSYSTTSYPVLAIWDKDNGEISTLTPHSTSIDFSTTGFSAITDVVIYDPTTDDTRPDWGDVMTDVVFFTGSWIDGDFDRMGIG